MGRTHTIVWLWFSLASMTAWSEDSRTSVSNQPPIAAVSSQYAKSLLSTNAKGLVLIFISTDCPVSNRYAPEIQRLSQEFGPKGLEFRLVYPNADETAEVARKHLADFKYQIPALIDHEHRLVKAAGVHTTPESAVYVAGQGWVYHGRIDDRDVELGKMRPQAHQRDLHEVLEAIAGGQKVSPHATVAVGCTIAPLP